jgi:hypothetical protein
MKLWSTLSTLALAGALVSSPVLAGTPAGDRSSLSGDGSVVRGDSLMHQERKIEAAEVMDGANIEGQVAAIEHNTGRLILDTKDGPISLTAAPEDLEGVAVGDTILVSLATDVSN